MFDGIKDSLATALGITCAVFFAIILVQYHMISSRNATIALHEQTISMLSAANTQMKDSIQNQNQAIDDLKKKSDDLKKKADAAVKLASVEAKKHMDAAQAIIDMKVSGDDCTASNAILNSYLQKGGI